MRPESPAEPARQLAVSGGGLPGGRGEADRASHAARGTAWPRLVLGARAAGPAGLVAHAFVRFPWQAGCCGSGGAL